MTKEKVIFPPEVIRTFEYYQSVFPTGYVKKLGTSNGLEYYRFIIPDGEDGPPLTGYPLVCSWNGREAVEIIGMAALRLCAIF